MTGSLLQPAQLTFAETIVLNRAGHGLQRSFLVSILQELAESQSGGQPALILGVEEPELYQHPPQARHLATVLRDLSRSEGQIVISTHSPYFVTGEGFENIRRTRKDSMSGQTIVSQFSYGDMAEVLGEALGEPVRQPTEIMAAVEQILRPAQNELFFSRVPILVEGPEDVAYLSTYLKFTQSLRKSG